MDSQERVSTPSPQTAVTPRRSTRPVSAKSAGNSEDRIMSNIIGWLLQGGVLLSSAITLVGLFMLYFSPNRFSLKKVEAFPHTLPALWEGLLTLEPQAIMVLGLMLLVATPVLRVAVSVIAFGLERDMRYVIITLIVLAILITSFLLGRGGA